MQIIINWLKGAQNYTVGATLYKSFGNDEAFKRLLLQGETPALKKQLAEQLQKLVAPEAAEEPPPIQEVRDVATPPETREIPVGDDVVLLAIKNEWHPLYQRMNLLRHGLDKYGADNSKEAIAYRQPIAAEIKRLEKEINAVWAKQKYYEKEGKLPFITSKKLEIPTDPLQLARLMNNIKKSIRTNRKLMKDNPGNPKYAQLYNQYKEQHKEVTGEDYQEKE